MATIIREPSAAPGACCSHHDVQKYENGRSFIETRGLVKPFSVTRRTLKIMDKNLANLTKGAVSDPIQEMSV
jgi:hypothetical protein